MWLLVFAELFGLASLLHLWLKPGRVVRKLSWSGVVLLPVLGPLLYLGAHDSGANVERLGQYTTWLPSDVDPAFRMTTADDQHGDST